MDNTALSSLLEQCRDSRLNAWALGNDAVSAPPYQFYINPTNICSNRCVMCPHDKVMREDRGMMSMDLFKRIVEQLPGNVHRVYMLKQGEPFLNKRLPEMMRHLKERRPDIYLAVHTNTSVPMASVMPDVLESVDSMGFSVSAVSKETYLRVHGRDHFEAVMENMRIAHECLADMAPGDRPHVFIDYVRQDSNSNETMEQVIAFHEERFPLFSSLDFHPMFNWQGDIDEANVDPDSLLSADEFPCCIFPWSTMTICHDGKVSYCQEEAKENVFLGDVNEETIEEIWNNAKYRSFRARMKNLQYQELLDDGFYCRKCSYLWNMHSQAPQNLAQGYFKKKNAGPEPRFGNLLVVSAEELLEYAARFYLRGEMHKAIGILEHLKFADCPVGLIRLRDELSGMCGNVLKQYRHMYKAKQAMKECGAVIHPNVYHQLGVNQVKP